MQKGFKRTEVYAFSESLVLVFAISDVLCEN